MSWRTTRTARSASGSSISASAACSCSSGVQFSRFSSSSRSSRSSSRYVSPTPPTLYPIPSFTRSSFARQDAATVTPDTACYDPRLLNQTCPDDVTVEYYLWNITNAPAWLAGTEAPAYDEIGPYAFKTSEVRYNLTYDPQWESVEYAFHQYAAFDPEHSCSGCSLNDTLTSVNRAYLQFIAAGQGSPAGMDSETAVMSTLLPSSLKLYLDTISAFMAPLSGSSDPDAIYNATLSQWAACGPVELVQGLYNLPTPFLKDSGLAPLTYHPEFCQFIVETLETMYPGVTVAPSALPSFGKYRYPPRSSLSPADSLPHSSSAFPSFARGRALCRRRSRVSRLGRRDVQHDVPGSHGAAVPPLVPLEPSRRRPAAPLGGLGATGPGPVDGRHQHLGAPPGLRAPHDDHRRQGGY